MPPLVPALQAIAVLAAFGSAYSQMLECTLEVDSHCCADTNECPPSCQSRDVREVRGARADGAGFTQRSCFCDQCDGRHPEDYLLQPASLCSLFVGMVPCDDGSCVSESVGCTAVPGSAKNGNPWRVFATDMGAGASYNAGASYSVILTRSGDTGTFTVDGGLVGTVDCSAVNDNEAGAPDRDDSDGGGKVPLMVGH